MNILITGAKGFVGKNLVEALKNIKEGKDGRFSGLCIEDIYEYDINSNYEDLVKYCKTANFVFNLAGVNRPKDTTEFMKGNFGFGEQLLNVLKECNNKCPVMLSSSIQASLEGRYQGSEYGKSKKAGEDLFFKYSKECGVSVLVYRFPNLFGKWCKPNYNSVVATFCHNIANDLPIQVSDPNNELQLAYIDDVVNELINALMGKENRQGDYCYVEPVYHVTLGEITDLLHEFSNQQKSLMIPSCEENSFKKKLYSTFLSYFPINKMIVPLNTNFDSRGAFTEIIKTLADGQVSVNVSRPGITKGQHWHNSKWEMFLVVSGEAVIEERKIGTDEKIVFDVSGDKLEMVYMLPGYTHNIINKSTTKDLVTIMWANELFDKNKPDTYREEV